MVSVLVVVLSDLDFDLEPRLDFELKSVSYYFRVEVGVKEETILVLFRFAELNIEIQFLSVVFEIG